MIQKTPMCSFLMHIYAPLRQFRQEIEKRGTIPCLPTALDKLLDDLLLCSSKDFLRYGQKGTQSTVQTVAHNYLNLTTITIVKSCRYNFTQSAYFMTFMCLEILIDLLTYPY